MVLKDLDVIVSEMCDHMITLTEVLEIIDDSGEKISRCSFKISQEGSEREDVFRKKVANPVEYFGSKEFFIDMENEGVIFYSKKSKYVEALRNHLLIQYRELEKEKVRMLRQGVSMIEGTVICVLGERIYPKDVEAVGWNATYHLHNKNKRFLECLEEFLNLDQVLSPMLVMYAAFSVLQGYLPFCGVMDRFVLVIEGVTGELKSTTAKIATDIFKEKINVSFSATKSSIYEKFESIGNVPVLIDDFNKSSFSENVRAKGVVLSEIIQSYPDRNAVTKMVGKEVRTYDVRAGIIITTEEMPKNPGTINRCLIVRTDEGISASKLRNVQKHNNHLFSTLVQELNEYIINNFAELSKNIQSNYEWNREQNQFLPYSRDQVMGYYRVMSNYALGKISIDLLKQLVESIGMDTSENRAKLMADKMDYALKECCREVCDRISIKEARHEYIDYIDDCFYQEWENKCADSYEKYYRRRDKYIGIYQDNIFWITGNKLLQLIEPEYPQASKKAVSEQLNNFNLLKIGSDGKKSIHHPEDRSGTRFYAIYIKELHELSREYFYQAHPSLRDFSVN